MPKKIYELAEEFKQVAKAEDDSVLDALTRKVMLLEKENEELKKRVYDLLKAPDERSNPAIEICEEEIRKLKLCTTERELTYEEAKKLDLYVKNLNLLLGKGASRSEEVKEAGTSELLKELVN